MKTLLVATLALAGAHVVLGQSTVAPQQTQTQQAQTVAPANQLTPQVLAEMLRSATTFNELVRNLNKDLGPDVHVAGADGLPQHSIERTAETIGAGAGAGAAIGAMTHNQNGVLIGALIGGAGGLIVDEILKHREETHPKPTDAPAPATGPTQRQ